MQGALGAKQIEELLEALDAELRADGVVGEVHVVGGAVMCLVFRARPSTRDVHAHFEPTQKIRRAAARVAAAHGLAEDWLNDAAKGFLSPRGEFRLFLDLPNLRVFTAQPEYLLAMKCLALRLGAEFHDESDVRFLLRLLNVERHDRAVEIVTRYYPRSDSRRRRSTRWRRSWRRRQGSRAVAEPSPRAWCLCAGVEQRVGKLRAADTSTRPCPESRITTGGRRSCPWPGTDKRHRTRFGT
jgi:hypothetical protein